MSTTIEEEEERSVKVMFVGDDNCGKTPMLVRYCRGEVDSYRPSAFDSYNVPATIDNVFLYLSLWDSFDGGSESAGRMRAISYKGVHAFVLCFSIYYEDSFKHVKSKWFPEIQRSCPGVPILLVGTDNIDVAKGRTVKQKVTQAQIDALAKELAVYKYVQVSVYGALDNVFAESVRAALSRYKGAEEDGKCLSS